MEEKFLQSQESQRATGATRSIYDRIKAGTFPNQSRLATARWLGDSQTLMLGKAIALQRGK